MTPTPPPALSEERIAALEALALGEMPFYERIAAFHGITINAAWSKCLDSGTEFTHACDPQTILALCALLRGTSEQARDAERFEWVRDHAQSGLVQSDGRTVHRWSIDLPYWQGVSSDWLRDGIDAARSATHHQESPT